jgi:hypothetical protein
MATATLNNNAVQSTSPTSPSIVTEKFDVAYGLKTVADKNDQPILDKDGKTQKEAVLIVKVAEAEALSEKNLFEGSTITVKCDYPASFDGLIAFANREWKDDDGKVRDPEDVKAEIVKLFVNGAAGKVMNRLRALATKQDKDGKFELTGDVIDLTNEITSGSKRVFLTEAQKIWKGLKDLPVAVRESVWKAYLTNTNQEFYLPSE